MVDLNAFSNAIRLIVYLITGKWIYIYFNAFCFFRMQHDPFHTKIDLLYLGFVSSNLKCVMGAFFTKEFTVSF